MAKAVESKFRTVTASWWSAKSADGKEARGPEYSCWACGWRVRLSPEAKRSAKFLVLGESGRRRVMTPDEKKAIDTRTCPECRGSDLRTRSAIRRRQPAGRAFEAILRGIDKDIVQETFGKNGTEMRRLFLGIDPLPVSFMDTAAKLSSGLKRMNFMEAVIARRATAEDIDKYITSWKKGSDGPLSAFLGMTEEEFTAWKKDPVALDGIIESRLNG